MVADARVALFTTTFYNDSPEGKLRKGLASRFVQTAVDKGYPVFVVDGGTDDGRYIEDLKKWGAKAYLETQRGLGPSRREALDYADAWARENGVPYLSWSEPEKVDFVRHIDNLIDAMQVSESKLVVPSRASLEGYPTAQQWSEKFGNQLHTDGGYIGRGGQPLDTFFGPKVWHREMSPFFQVFGRENEKVAQELAQMRYEKSMRDYSASNSIESLRDRAEKDLRRTDHMQHMPVCLMILEDNRALGEGAGSAIGFPVISHTIPYVHPPEQTEVEQRKQDVWNKKRLGQMNWLAEQFDLVRRLHINHTLDENLYRMLEEAKTATRLERNK